MHFTLNHEEGHLQEPDTAPSPNKAAAAAGGPSTSCGLWGVSAGACRNSHNNPQPCHHRRGRRRPAEQQFFLVDLCFVFFVFLLFIHSFVGFLFVVFFLVVRCFVVLHILFPAVIIAIIIIAIRCRHRATRVHRHHNILLLHRNSNNSTPGKAFLPECLSRQG